MKPHQMAALVNELRDIAVEFHSTQQLRERISQAVNAALAQQPAQALPQGAIFAGWLREWEGDDSDLGQWLFAATEEDKDDSPNWRPVYWLNAAPTPPRVQNQQPDPERLKLMLARLISQAERIGALLERCQGKGWPQAESDEFTRLRDVHLPGTLLAIEQMFAEGR